MTARKVNFHRNVLYVPICLQITIYAFPFKVQLINRVKSQNVTYRMNLCSLYIYLINERSSKTSANTSCVMSCIHLIQKLVWAFSRNWKYKLLHGCKFRSAHDYGLSQCCQRGRATMKTLDCVETVMSEIRGQYNPRRGAVAVFFRKSDIAGRLTFSGW
jgi:hypothetical protein